MKRLPPATPDEECPSKKRHKTGSETSSFIVLPTDILILILDMLGSYFYLQHFVGLCTEFRARLLTERDLWGHVLLQYFNSRAHLHPIWDPDTGEKLLPLHHEIAQMASKKRVEALAMTKHLFFDHKARKASIVGDDLASYFKKAPLEVLIRLFRESRRRMSQELQHDILYPSVVCVLCGMEGLDGIAVLGFHYRSACQLCDKRLCDDCSGRFITTKYTEMCLSCRSCDVCQENYFFGAQVVICDDCNTTYCEACGSPFSCPVCHN